jgi:hypothetical protein
MVEPTTTPSVDATLTVFEFVEAAVAFVVMVL